MNHQRLARLKDIVSECLERQRLCMEGKLYDPSWTDSDWRHNWWSTELRDAVFNKGIRMPIECETCARYTTYITAYEKSLLTPEEREEEDKLVQASIEAIKEFEQEIEQEEDYDKSVEEECDWIDKDGCKCTNEEYNIVVIGDIFGPEPTRFISYCKKHEPQAKLLVKKYNLLIAEKHIPSLEEEQT